MISISAMDVDLGPTGLILLPGAKNAPSSPHCSAIVPIVSKTNCVPVWLESCERIFNYREKLASSLRQVLAEPTSKHSTPIFQTSNHRPASLKKWQGMLVGETTARRADWVALYTFDSLIVGLSVV